MIEFLINYWMVLLIAFILVLLVILGYLVDKEKKNNKNIVNVESKDIYEDKLVAKVNDGNVNEEKDKKTDVPKIETPDKIEIDDEISKIDKEFESVIPKRKLIDDNLKVKIDDLKIEPIKISKIEDERPKIELPDIKITKK